MAEWYYMDTEAVLDFTFNWSSWLASGETISSYTINEATGLTVNSDGLDDDSEQVTVWLQADAASAGTDYALECKIVTSDGRTDERTMTIRVRDR